MFNIKPYDGLERYEVESEETPGKWYLVDLDGYFGNGWCNCPDFACNREPLLAKGQRPLDHRDDTYRCKHIVACLNYLGRDLAGCHLHIRQKKYNKTHEIT